jgi:hypothetical protein
MNTDNSKCNSSHFICVHLIYICGQLHLAFLRALRVLAVAIAFGGLRCRPRRVYGFGTCDSSAGLGQAFRRADAAQRHVQRLAIGGILHRLGMGNQLLVEKREQILVERLLAAAGALEVIAQF